MGRAIARIGRLGRSRAASRGTFFLLARAFNVAARDLILSVQSTPHAFRCSNGPREVPSHCAIVWREREMRLRSPDHI